MVRLTDKPHCPQKKLKLSPKDVGLSPLLPLPLQELMLLWSTCIELQAHNQELNTLM